MSDVIIEYSSRGAEQVASEQQRLQAQFDSTAKGATDLARSLNTSFKSAQNFAKNLGLTTQQAARAVQRIRELNTTNANSAQRYRALNKELGISRKQFLELDKAVSTQASRLNDLRRQQQVATEGYRNLGVAAGAVAAVITKAFADSTRTFVEFSSALQQVGAISGSLGTDEFEALSDEIDRLGIATTKAPAEIAQTSIALARAGLQAEEITDALEGVVRASEATGESLATTGDITAQTLRVFGLAADESNRVADLLVATANNSNTNIASLGESLSFVGAQANAANQPLDDTLILLGLLADSGIRGSSAGTQLGAALERLKAASAGAESEFTNLVRGNQKAVEAFNLISADVRNADGSMRSLLEIIPVIEQNLGRLSQQDQDLIFKALFGVQGGRAIQSIIGSTATQVDALTDSVRNSEGVAAETSEVLLQDLGGALRRLQGSLQGLSKDAGGFIAQFLQPLVQAATGAINAFLSLPEPIKQVTFGIVALTGAFAGLVAASSLYIALNVKKNVTLGILAAKQLSATAATAAHTTAIKAQNLALGVSVGSVASLAAALGVLAAAFAVFDLVNFTNQLREANAAIANSGLGVEASSNSALAAAQRTQNAIDSLNDARERGLSVGAEELAQAGRLANANDQRIEQFKTQLEELEKQREAIPDSVGLGGSIVDAVRGDDPAANALEGQRNAINAQIAEVQRNIESLEDRNQALRDTVANEGQSTEAINKTKEALEAVTKAQEEAFQAGQQDRSDNFSDQQRTSERQFERQQRAEQEAFQASQNAEREALEDSIAQQREALEDQLNRQKLANEDAIAQQQQQTQQRLNNEQQSFNDSQNREKERLERRLQDAERSFNQQQQDEARQFNQQLNRERQAAEAGFDAEQREIDLQVELAGADSASERRDIQERFDEGEEERQLRESLEADLNARREAFAQEQANKELEFQRQQEEEELVFQQRVEAIKAAQEQRLQASREAFETSLEARRQAIEERLQAQRETFEEQLAERRAELEEQSQARIEALEATQRSEQQAFEDAQLDKQDAFADRQRDLERSFQAEQQAREEAFNAEQRSLDEASAEQQKAILESANISIGGLENRREGGSMKAGQPYLVGDGPGGKITPYSEVVVPGTSSYVVANRKVKAFLAQDYGNIRKAAPPSAPTSRTNSTTALLSEIKGLRKDLAKRPQVSIDKLSMPTSNYLERDDLKIAKVASQQQRAFMRSLTRMGE